MIRPILVLLVMIAILAAAADAPSYGYMSPTALVADPDGHRLYVAETAGSCVAVVDVAVGRVVREIDLPEPPSDLLLDGSTLFVTTGSPAGGVYMIDVESCEIVQRIAAGHMPRSPILSSDGATLYVLNRFENLVSFIDTATGEMTTRVPVPREPIDAALTPDGEALLVLNHLPIGAATAEPVAAEISFIDTASRRIAASVKLPNGSTSARGICISPDGRFAFCTHILARFHNPTTQLVRGWMNTNAFSIIDLESSELYATVLLDDVDLGAANPWGVRCSADGKLLAITHAGTHEISLIDLPGLLRRLADLDDHGRAGVGDELSFLAGLRKRIALAGNGPREALFLGSELYTTEYFSDSLGVIDTTAAPGEQAVSIALGPGGPVDPIRQGEIFFHDASLCFQGWQSCSSCHPDGRADALNWDLLNDGFGNPKNTKSMLHAHETPPAMITGIRASAEVAVRAGVRHIQFASRPDEDMQAIDQYLKSMVPAPSPWLVDGELSPAAERGSELFTTARCDVCHNGPYYTDLLQHDLGMALGQDEGRPMDTPTLIETWRTAPYLHDGRAADLRSLFTEHNGQDRHGITSTLGEAELEDLIAYLQSL